MVDAINELLALAHQEFGQLTDADKRLLDAVAHHEVANFKADTDDLNEPESSAQWGTDRTLQADRLIWLLTSPEVVELISFRGLQIVGAKIEGELNLEYAIVSVPLIFDTCVFTAPLILKNSKLRSLQLKNTHVPGIQADEMQVENSVSLCDGFKAKGEVNLLRATIGGVLDCGKGEFSNPGETALNINAASIASSVILNDGFQAEGEISLVRASIGGNLTCFRGQFSNPGKIALNANAASIAYGVNLNQGFKADGEVKFFLATIGGQLNCNRGIFNNPDGLALNADTASIASAVLLRNGFKAKGEVILRRATIGGKLACDGGEFNNADQPALNANAATIVDSVYLCDGFKAVGGVNLCRVKIGGNLHCQGGHFLNKEGYALKSDSGSISGSVFLGEQFNTIPFRAEGKVSFLNATIDDRFELRGMDIPNSELMSLDLRFAKVNTFSFKDADAEKTWIDQMQPGQLCLNGFVYDALNVSNHAIKHSSLFDWLQLQIKADSTSELDNNFALQPYEQLAAVLNANGHQGVATAVLIAKEEDRRRYGGLTGWGRVWNKFLGITIDHGYRPQKALLWSVFVMLIGWGIFSANQGLITKADDKQEFFAFNPLVYSIDVFTPVVDFHQESNWLPDPSKGNEISLLLFKARQGEVLRTYFWFQIVAGWVLTSLWVAGFTGVVRSQK